DDPEAVRLRDAVDQFLKEAKARLEADHDWQQKREESKKRLAEMKASFTEEKKKAMREEREREWGPEAARLYQELVESYLAVSQLNRERPDVSFFDPAYRAWREKLEKVRKEQREKMAEKRAEFELGAKARRICHSSFLHGLPLHSCGNVGTVTFQRS